VPTDGLEGKITVQGIREGKDEVVIRIRDTLEKEEDTVVEVDKNMEFTIDLKHSLVRAERTKSSGNEIFVWLN
jgi:hypothetical protein